MPINENRNLYFGYGSNLNKGDLIKWCEKRSCKYPFTTGASFKAKLIDYRLGFNHYSQTRKAYALNVMEKVGSVVEGIVFEVDGEEGWNTIDKKEGAPGHYRRVPVVVNKENNELIKAYTYLSTRPDSPEIVQQKREGQSGDYYRIVRDGYKSHGLKSDILDMVYDGENHPPFTDAVFVYGTLMRGQSRFGVIENNRPVSILSGEVSGRLIDLCAYPGLVEVNSSSYRVKGEIVSFGKEITSLLKKLDRIEEFYGMDSDDSLYYRIPVRVDLEGGHSKEAWTYLYSNPPENPRYIPDGRWV